MIEKIVILTLCSIAICSTTWPDMIFSKPAEWIESKIGIMAKPLFGCYVCATIWYSAIICLVIGWNPLLAIPAMGLSAVISILQND
jgi:hypothetical protein